jgi:hypothetical protein
MKMSLNLNPKLTNPITSNSSDQPLATQHRVHFKLKRTANEKNSTTAWSSAQRA